MTSRTEETTPNYRIGDLRFNMGLSQKELSEMIDITPSQLNRIENGKTYTISSDILIKLAKAFNVSTDYILGLTTISKPKSYDISRLGLSEGAVMPLVTGKVRVEVLNRLLEHKNFPHLMDSIKIYFEDTAKAGVMARNEVMDMATSMLVDFGNEKPEHKAEIRNDIKFINAQKLSEHEAEFEKIKNILMSILKDIKKDMDEGKSTGKTATADFLQQLREQLKGKAPGEVTAENMADMVTDIVKRSTALDGRSSKVFNWLAKYLFKNVGKNKDK